MYSQKRLATQAAILILVLTTMHMPSTAAQRTRCGRTWADANNKCGRSCPGGQNRECPSNENCYASLSTAPCGGGGNTGGSSTGGPTRCGAGWSNANSKCGVSCSTDIDCPGSERCYASLDTSVCPSSGGGPVTSSSSLRCGSSWSDANTRCRQSCPNGENRECPWGQSCYRDLSTSPCGTSGTPTITPAVTTTPNPTVHPGTTPTGGTTHRLVAFVENWKTCPSSAQLSRYTHVLVSFAVSYTWSPGKNQCSSSCSVSTPPVCLGGGRSTIRSWQSQGIKVLLSFGGAGMGGSWAGDNNDCWEYCYSRVDTLTNQLASIVSSQGYDGIDIDFEYHLTSKAVSFLKTLTTGLRSKLPRDSLITHTPMDGDLDRNDPYFNVLKETASIVDFLMPQYYNGNLKPHRNLSPVLSHYSNLVNDVFNGDASRVLFGFCVNECGAMGSNVNGDEALSVIRQIDTRYPTCGGVFFWAASADNSWSSRIVSELDSNRERQRAISRGIEPPPRSDPGDDPLVPAGGDGPTDDGESTPWYKDMRIIVAMVGASGLFLAVAIGLVAIHKKRQRQQPSQGGNADGQDGTEMTVIERAAEAVSVPLRNNAV